MWNKSKYDYIIFDTVNTGYHVFNHPDHVKENKSEIILFQEKKVYKYFFRNFIEQIEHLKHRFLSDSGELIFLFDNYESREELKELLKPLNPSQNRRKINPTYKSTRTNQRYEFYNTLDMVRYYYLIQSDKYHTARIPNLEADDLVPICIQKLNQDITNNILLVTNDSDWCRYLSDTTHYLPNLHDNPVDRDEYKIIHGYFPTEGRVILNKVVYGDSTDNIDSVFPDWSRSLKDKVIDYFDDVQDFMINANKLEDLKEYLPMIKEREYDIRMAYQMLASIPVSLAHFNAVYTTGRNSITMLENIDKKFYSEKNQKSGFVFGLTIPRVDP